MSVRYAVKTYGTNEAIKIVRRNVPILTIINSCKFCDRLSTILNLPKTALATEPFLNVEAIRESPLHDIYSLEDPNRGS